MNLQFERFFAWSHHTCFLHELNFKSIFFSQNTNFLWDWTCFYIYISSRRQTFHSSQFTPPIFMSTLAKKIDCLSLQFCTKSYVLCIIFIFLNLFTKMSYALCDIFLNPFQWAQFRWKRKHRVPYPKNISLLVSKPNQTL